MKHATLNVPTEEDAQVLINLLEDQCKDATIEEEHEREFSLYQELLAQLHKQQ